MIFKKRNKCPLCERKMGRGEEFWSVCLQTAEGEHHIDACNLCANILDGAAKVLETSRAKKESSFGQETEND